MKDVRSSRRRLYYAAGSISLVLLPLLCVLYLVCYRHAFDRARVIEITWWNENLAYDLAGDHPLKKRIYTDINLTDNDDENKVKLDFARLAIRQLIATNDTVRGIHFHFDDNSKYWVFIRALDICAIEKAKFYVAKDNDMWVFNFIPKPIPTEKAHYFFCGTGLMTKVINIDKTGVEATIDNIMTLAKKFPLPVLLFGMMIFLVTKRIHKTHV
jgi:hypothetical protein